jgi:hypothetical protein
MLWCDITKSIKNMSKQVNSLQSEAPSLPVPNKNLYNDNVQTEFLELQTDIDTLLQQLQGLSRQRLAESGSAQ